MIDQHLVFVLGAGASVPYGFPTGRGLLLKAVEHLLPGNDRLIELLSTHLGVARTDLQEFAHLLLRSRQPSIDAFIENRSEFFDMGKAVIAALLIPYEEERILSNPPNVNSTHGLKDTWLDYVFRKMDTDGDFSKNNVSVITFNYDRLVEYYFRQALKASYGLSDDDAEALAETVPTVHVHGQLGVLDHSGEVGRPFSGDLNATSLSRAVDGIRIITEVNDSDPVLDRARDLLEKAQRVCLLGFGYHPKNIQRLRLGVVSQHCEVVGTTVGLEDSEIDEILNRHIQMKQVDKAGFEALAFLKMHRVLW